MTKDIFELTFEKAAVGIAHVDAHGKWMRVNPYLCHFLGYSREELFLLTFQDITHPDDLKYDLDHAQQLREGIIESFTIEKRYIRKDGFYTWAQLSASSVRDEHGNIEYFISIISDINERKHLEYDLKRVEASFNTTGNYLVVDDQEYIFATVRDLTEGKKILRQLEQSNLKYQEINKSLKKAEQLAKLGNWRLDLANNELYWSDEIFNIFEIDSSRFQATYEAFLNAIHPDDREMVNQAYMRSLKTKEKYQIIHRLLLNENKIKYVMEQCETLFDRDGNPLQSIGTVQDITEIHAAHHQIRESEQFYRTIVSSIDKAILILEDNVILDCNPAAISLFDQSKQTLIGSDIFHLTYTIKSVDETFEEYLANAYQGNLIRFQAMLICNKGEKSNKIVDVTIANYGNETNKLILLTRDVTQKIEDEKFLKMHTRQAQMGEMISMIAHQWRQPLAIINSLTSRLRIKELLKEDEDVELIAQLTTIEQQSLYLSQTISDYRDFFRPDKPLETVSLSHLINHSLELIDHTLKSKGVTIRNCVYGPVYVEIYRNELIQVLVSLFKNSFDAFDENNIEERIITIEIENDEKYGIIRITDNAGGISAEIIEKIFIPYFTTKNHSHGTGLGLYMSKMIIEDHCRGVLEISSANRETTITLKLPYTSL